MHPPDYQLTSLARAHTAPLYTTDSGQLYHGELIDGGCETCHAPAVATALSSLTRLGAILQPVRSCLHSSDCLVRDGGALASSKLTFIAFIQHEARREPR